MPSTEENCHETEARIRKLVRLLHQEGKLGKVMQLISIVDHAADDPGVMMDDSMGI